MVPIVAMEMVVEVLDLGGWSCYIMSTWDVECILLVLASSNWN